MKKFVALFSASRWSPASAPLQTAQKPVKPAKPTTKVVDVWHCPIQGAEVKDHSKADKGTVVGNYRVHFCCAGCPEEFAKLPKAQQLAKARKPLQKTLLPRKKVNCLSRKALRLSIDCDTRSWMNVPVNNLIVNLLQ